MGATVTAVALGRADDLLRGGPWATESERPRWVIVQLVGLVVVCGVWYGAVMGTFGGVAGGRWLQVAYSAAKVPMLLLVTFGVSLPSFFVVNTLAGVREDFVRATRALVATQAAMTIVLASLSPVTAVWYASSADYPSAILFNAMVFGLASFAGQGLLRKLYRPLIEKNAVHRRLLRAWVVVYAFVGIQMGWVLRPFIGDPGRPVTFFREHMWGNAYEVVGRMIWEVVRR
jgi:hypothetical protein